MTTEAMSSASADAAPAPVHSIEITAPADAPEAVNSVSAAAKMLRAARQPKQPESSERAPQEAAPDTSSSPADDAAPLSEAPGETEAIDPAPQEPPIEPPRSWTADDKDAFRALPRETQLRISEREK